MYGPFDGSQKAKKVIDPIGDRQLRERKMVLENDFEAAMMMIYFTVVLVRGCTSLAFSKAHNLELFRAKAREPSRAYDPSYNTFSSF